MKILKIILVFIFVFVFSINCLDATSWQNRETDYDKGLVIEDRWGNQFVWVPIDPTKNPYDFENFNKGYSDIQMKEDINFDTSSKYGGYWISRYEVGNYEGRDEKPVSKKGEIAWTSTKYESLKSIAENFCKINGKDYTKFWKSGLMTGKAWDTMVNWIRTDVNIEDSRNWGNLLDFIPPANTDGYVSKEKKTTGFNENWKVKNIYDLAGNVWEATYEMANNNNIVNPNEFSTIYRGGSWKCYGYYHPVSYRFDGKKNNNYTDLGFRIQLYMDTFDFTNNGNEAGSKILKPKLYGMTPVKVSNNELIPTNSDDKDWFKYVNQDGDKGLSHWANAMTKDGSVFVWIPRYAYMIGPEFVNNGRNKEKQIHVKFVDINDRTEEGTKIPEGYMVHPAFNLPGNEKLSGIWVGKYESSDNATNNKIKVKPEEESRRNIRVEEAFERSYNMGNDIEYYGFQDLKEGATHLLKNMEWGAVSYLAHSNYGRAGKEVTINKNRTFITGRLENQVWNSAESIQTSTTANITGIYDMSGGAWEYVAGNYDWTNLNSNQYPNFQKIFSAKNEKYFDVYSSSDGKYGDATIETLNWFWDGNDFIVQDIPWFVRGGYWNSSGNSGIFSFDNDAGKALDTTGFRVAIFGQ